ncbi:MFS transporter [Bradyrhizobium sp. 2S1]|uniref:MFS transporter n=1 Tax=Bradyrhizobium sp. 2S1 TaxID=1404429 RepID=UPI00140D53D2|nr:MFS transporter [Bradyrhizobium sp. 2S1]MCK7673414.1 MFS transporter [Bradyrhizobium sp. 2S1]
MRYFVIVALACQQYLSIAFIYAAVPVILRSNGASLELVGLFSAVFFAFTINFLWAPVVDCCCLNRLGLRRSWILSTRALSAASMAVMAGLNPTADFVPVLMVCLALATLAATQRIATLGYVAEALATAERPFGAALLGWGGAIGNAIGGAVCLQLIEVVGWRPALLGFSLLLLVFAGWILAIPEPTPREDTASQPPSRLWIRAILRNQSLWTTAGLIAPAVLGVAVAFAMVQPRLVDLGFAAADIGWIGVLANVATFTIIAPLTSAMVARTAPHRAVVWGCTILALSFAGLAFIERYVGTGVSAVASVGIVFAALAVQHVAFTNWFLGLARPGETATDVTFLTSMMSAFALVGFAASGFIATKFGYGTTLILPGVGYALSALFAVATMRFRQNSVEPASDQLLVEHTQ